MGQPKRKIWSSASIADRATWPVRDLLSAMFVSAAAAVGIAVVVGGGTAGIQTPLVAPAAGVTMGPAPTVVPGGGPELSVRVLRPARLPVTGPGMAEPVVFAGPPAAVTHPRASLAVRSPKVVRPVVAPAAVVVPAPVPVPVAPVVAAPVVPAPKPEAKKTEAKKPEAKAKPKQDESPRSGATTSEYRSERAQTSGGHGHGRDRRDRGDRQD
jgi:hypothetical protein